MFNNIQYTFKGKRLVGSQLGENFAIEVDVGLFGSWNKLGITPIVLSDCCLQSHNPKLAPFALFSPAVSVSVLPCLVDPTNGDAEAVFGATAKSFGMLQQVLVLRME